MGKFLLNESAKSYYTTPSGYGDYQFVSINDLVTNFIMSYVGEDKIISKVKKTDVVFHARRAIQEFSFDTFPSEKALEIELPPSLSMVLPQDYVNYVRFSYTDNAGRERIIYPTSHTSNPDAISQDSNYNYQYDSDGDGQADDGLEGELLFANESNTLTNFKAQDSGDTAENMDQNDLINLYRYGRRYGLNPETAQAHGVFYIDKLNGIARFSSTLSGKTITMKYISDSLGTDEEQSVHKFTEEAIYKYLAHAILSTRANTPEYQIARFKKEARAAKRNAKLRLSNLKLGEIAQIMRNQSKWIKH